MLLAQRDHFDATRTNYVQSLMTIGYDFDHGLSASDCNSTSPKPQSSYTWKLVIKSCYRGTHILDSVDRRSSTRWSTAVTASLLEHTFHF